ncbi:hypothetical protein KUTeg_021726 [Tegillarca granosa]|uniref:AB hydrolase-1 domain-containing protein n=1 Tax=Tegillarca granosa TaxID=220873 RepID=A0ABQ9E9J5_TEGGR|nr:hypothetical protein KUTeg_021726 [Tegillarca granosa]
MRKEIWMLSLNLFTFVSNCRKDDVFKCFTPWVIKTIIMSKMNYQQSDLNAISFRMASAAKLHSDPISKRKLSICAFHLKGIQAPRHLFSSEKFSLGTKCEFQNCVGKIQYYHTTGQALSGVKFQKSTPELQQQQSELKDNFKCDILPQVEVPDKQDVLFKGMETDFPCLTRNKMTGPEPEYDKISSGFKIFTSTHPFPMKYNKSILPEVTVAYETWGKLNEAKDNAVIIQAGLSASSHAKSHKPYATTFPLISVEDMVHAQFLLLDYLGIEKLNGSVGSSLGGMLSIQAAALYPERVGRVVSISSCAQSHPSSIAMRYLQRKCIMSDPNWNKGYYYNTTFPKMGMKLAREIATMTYRSGPEWDDRFGRGRIDENSYPSLCPTFLIESYLEHQGESFSTKYDPNSILYISKCPTMVVGVQTDILFPIWQQRELAQALQDSGNDAVTYYELNSLYGHDTFLLDLNGVGAAVKGFLETFLPESGLATKHKTPRKKHKDRVLF